MSDKILDTELPWPRVDEFMSDEDLTTAAERIRSGVDWSKMPKLAEIFEHRPAVNRYWHELVALTLFSLEANGDVLNKRNDEPTVIAAVLYCPYCHLRHVDEGEWRTRPHHTHRCVGLGGCGKEWRVEPYCYGANEDEALTRS